MAVKSQSYLAGTAAIVLILAIIYLLDPSFGGLMRGNMQTLPPRGVEGFAGYDSAAAAAGGYPTSAGGNPTGYIEADGDVADKYTSVARFDETINPTGDSGNQTPNGCFPRKQLTPSELLPLDTNSVWAQNNPQGQGDLAGKNFMTAGANIGIQTIGTSRRNANLQFRSEPPNPQVKVSPWMQSTIEPDIMRRPLELGE